MRLYSVRLVNRKVTPRTVPGSVQSKSLSLLRKDANPLGRLCCICRLLSARFASVTDSPEKIRTLSGGGSSRGTQLQKLPPLRFDLPRLIGRQRRGRRKFIMPRKRPAGVNDRLGVRSDTAFLIIRRNTGIQRRAPG